MTQRCDTRVHANTDASRGGHILEMTLFRLNLVAFLLESLKKFEQNFLGDFAPSSFQVGKPRESEIWVQLVSCRVEGTPHRHFRIFDGLLNLLHLDSSSKTTRAGPLRLRSGSGGC